MNLKHLHLHVRHRPAAEAFYATWLGMTVARRGESLTFMSDDDGFDLALMDDAAPAPMPAWFHFGCRLPTSQAVVETHRRMSEAGIPIRKALYEDDSLVSFRCADPDGYSIEIYWEADRGPRLM
jgi:catechol-2,3-dioxygenase